MELELHIEGIGPDKISDLVANIIKGLLAEYTQQVCADYRIETRPECAVNNFWNSETLEWDAGYFDLPVRDNDAYILVPKRFVRCEEDTVNHQVFYDKYVLNILQREMVDASDALVETLKSGERRVTKRSLRGDGRFTPSKEFISQFIQEHPSVMDQYRDRLKNPPVPTDLAQLSGKAAEDDPAIRATLNTVLALPSGSKQATEYHNAVFELLQFIFDWCLQDFEKEYEMDQGRGRIDIICNNAAGRGLFAELRTELNATSIPIECKNYSSDLGNDEFNQLNDRLGKKSSRLGFLFCRKIEKPQDVYKHLSDRWLRHENCLLLFDDTHLKQLVEMRLKRDYTGIESLLRTMIRDVKFAATPQQLLALNVADEAQPSSN